MKKIRITLRKDWPSLTNRRMTTAEILAEVAGKVSPQTVGNILLEAGFEISSCHALITGHPKSETTDFHGVETEAIETVVRHSVMFSNVSRFCLWRHEYVRRRYALLEAAIMEVHTFPTRRIML